MQAARFQQPGQLGRHHEDVATAARITNQTLADRLVLAVPEFSPVLSEHIADYGEVLNHLLLGELVPFMEGAHSSGDGELVRRILDFAEHALLSGDDYVQEAIVVSFVENAGPLSKPGLGAFISSWPPALREAARDMGYPVDP